MIYALNKIFNLCFMFIKVKIIYLQIQLRFLRWLLLWNSSKWGHIFKASRFTHVIIFWLWGIIKEVRKTIYTIWRLTKYTNASKALKSPAIKKKKKRKETRVELCLTERQTFLTTERSSTPRAWTCRCCQSSSALWQLLFLCFERFFYLKNV